MTWMTPPKRPGRPVTGWTPRLESWSSAQADWTRLARARNLLMEAGICSIIWYRVGTRVLEMFDLRTRISPSNYNLMVSCWATTAVLSWNWTIDSGLQFMKCFIGFNTKPTPELLDVGEASVFHTQNNVAYRESMRMFTTDFCHMTWW